MKVTKVLARAVSAAWSATNLTPDMAGKLLAEPGVFRGVHNMEQKDFATYRVERVTGSADDVVTYESVVKEGGRLGRAPSLLVSAGVAEYIPLPGEHAIAVGFDADTNEPACFPVSVSAVHGNVMTCVGIYEGEPWGDEFDAVNVLIPTTYIGAAGLLSTHTFHQYFQVADHTHVSQAEMGMVDARLAEASLTYRDLIDYILTPVDEDITTLKFYKKVMKKHKVGLEHDLLHFMKTGDLIVRNDAAEDDADKPATVKAATTAKAPAKPLVKANADAPLTIFVAEVAAMKGKQLQDLYGSICKLSRMKEELRQTTASKIKAHIVELVTAERLEKLIAAGAYELPGQDAKKAA